VPADSKNEDGRVDDWNEQEGNDWFGLDIDPEVTLTGPYDTHKLPRITRDPVTVTVSRVPKPGMGGQANVIVEELVDAMQNAPGSLGAGVLRGGRGPDSPIQVVGRFSGAFELRRWESSAERAALLMRLEPLVDSSNVAVAANVDGWFAAASVPSERGLIRQVVTDAAWIYPIALTVSLFAGPLLARLDIVERVTFSVLLIGSLSALVVVPIRRAVRKARMKRAPLR
jgi:uncharacterized protein